MKKIIILVLMVLTGFTMSTSVFADESVDDEIISTQEDTYGISLEDLKYTSVITDNRDGFLAMMGFKIIGNFEMTSYKLYLHNADGNGSIKELEYGKLVAISSEARVYTVEIIASGDVNEEPVEDISATAILEIAYKTITGEADGGVENPSDTQQDPVESSNTGQDVKAEENTSSNSNMDRPATSDATNIYGFVFILLASFVGMKKSIKLNK